MQRGSENVQAGRLPEERPRLTRPVGREPPARAHSGSADTVSQKGTTDTTARTTLAITTSRVHRAGCVRLRQAMVPTREYGSEVEMAAFIRDRSLNNRRCQTCLSGDWYYSALRLLARP